MKRFLIRHFGTLLFAVALAVLWAFMWWAVA